ncbi:PIR Superfamily Protein [Plasmodium ovale wallikeri]|uniref:PIR Superfamily Protein n=1 Tax=Plasmodium ovale wallikeri TaxID=864142 RepID=A0A1A8YP58_PLAOA|nr:PIR Superfamily Protein [Plasmodium ovale wallikeri]SBT33559.1 PIR Superfamily Protein [Plasmodium ovale wallikeri]
METKCPSCHKEHISTDSYRKELNEIPNISHINEIYLEKIKNITDPILLYHSLSLIKHYEYGSKQFSKCTYKNNVHTACQHLNYWLGQRKHIYTCGRKCVTREKFWKEQIQPLYELLHSNNKNEGEHWCNINPHIFHYTFPENITLPDICQKSVSTVKINSFPKEYNSPTCECNNCDNLTLPSTSCDCTNRYDRISASPEKAEYCENSRPCPMELYTGLSVFLTLCGCFFILFLLCKFTPLISWLYGRRIKEKRLMYHIDDDETDEFLAGRSHNTDAHYGYRQNEIFYQSM